MEEIEYNLTDYDYEIINGKIKIKTKIYEYNINELLIEELTDSSIIKATNNNGNLTLSYKGLLDNILCEFTAKKLKEKSIYKNRIIDGIYTYKGYHILHYVLIYV